MTYDELREKQRELEALLTHAGWQRLQTSVEEQIRLRRQEDFNKTIVGMDTVVQLASGRGEIAGLKLALALPSIILDDIKADIHTILEAQRAEEEEAKEEGK